MLLNTTLKFIRGKYSKGCLIMKKLNGLLFFMVVVLLFSSCKREGKKAVPRQFIREAVMVSNHVIEVRFYLYLDKRFEERRFWKIIPAVDIISIKNVRRWGRRSGLYAVRIKQRLDKKIKYKLKVGPFPLVKILPERKKHLPFSGQVKNILARYTAGKPQGKTLFIGSSSFTMWHQLEDDMKPMAALNHGFGGAMIWQVLGYMKKLVYPFAPKRVVMYCGENDIAAGFSPERVRNDYLKFVSLLRKKYGGIPVYYCSMKPSPSRWHLWKKFKRGNYLIKAFCLKTKGNHYIDVSTPMLDKTGQVRTDIWKADKLHMNRKGYTDIWIPVIKKALQ